MLEQLKYDHLNVLNDHINVLIEIIIIVVISIKHGKRNSTFST